MKSDSLIKVTASVLSLSLLASTCFTTVSEAAGSTKGIISENPVTVSAYMMQSMKSSTVDNVISSATNDVASKVVSKAGLNKETTEQKKTTEVRSAKDIVASVAAKIANEKIEEYTNAVENTNVATNGVTVNNDANQVNQDGAATSEEKASEEVSKYANKGIAIADVVNIRKKADTVSEIVGRLYKGSMCTILAEKDGWVKIESGSVKGNIRKDLLAIGEEAEKIAPKYAKKYAVINTVTLKVREKNNTESTVLTLVGQDEKYRIIKEGEKWCKIRLDDETVGFVLKEYVKVVEKFDQAKSMEQILEEMEEEEEAQNVAAEENNSSSSKKKTSSSKKRTYTTKKSSSVKKSSSSKKTYSKAGSKTGSSVASFALQFKGNPYRYGGTSLTNGTDCSGFTQSVYRNFGYSIGRDSRSQYAGAGRIVSMNDLQPGDLLFYGSSSGRINHVALYIGGGQVVHASNRKDGIKVSNYRYRTPLRARRVIN